MVFAVHVLSCGWHEVCISVTNSLVTPTSIFTFRRDLLIRRWRSPLESQFGCGRLSVPNQTGDRESQAPPPEALLLWRAPPNHVGDPLGQIAVAASPVGGIAPISQRF